MQPEHAGVVVADAGTWVWAETWEPGPELRAVRHRVANLLVPVMVATELIDAGGPEGDMLADAVARIGYQLDRVGALLRLEPPQMRRWAPADLAQVLDIELAGDPAGFDVNADAAGIAERVCDELAQGGCNRLRLYCTELGGVHPGRFVIIASDSDEAPLSAEEIARAAIPLSSARAGVGLALAAAEARRHGGWLRGRTDRATIEVLLPAWSGAE